MYFVANAHMLVKKVGISQIPNFVYHFNNVRSVNSNNKYILFVSTENDKFSGTNYSTLAKHWHPVTHKTTLACAWYIHFKHIWNKLEYFQNDRLSNRLKWLLFHITPQNNIEQEISFINKWFNWYCLSVIKCNNKM